MTSVYFMIALAVLQTGAAVFLIKQNPWLAAVYGCYAVSNLFLIGVAR